MTGMGLRERKKEKTRLALVDAALDLFLEHGYDATTIDQVAGAADVSPRTFFRYFTSKDHLILWFHDQMEETMLEALAARPAGEPPFASMTHALRAQLRTMEEATPEDVERFLKVRRLLDATPHLASSAYARAIETERRLVETVAARRGLDPAPPPGGERRHGGPAGRPHLPRRPGRPAGDRPPHGGDPPARGALAPPGLGLLGPHPFQDLRRRVAVQYA